MRLTPAYAAPCVRACAIRGDRIGPAQWRRLLEMPRTADVVAWLAQRGRVAGSPGDTAECGRQLREGMIRAVGKILRFCGPAAAEPLRHFIFYYDLLNIEAVLCSLHAAQAAAAPRLLYDTGRFGLLRKDDLALAGSLPALGGLLRDTPFRAPFEAAAAAYGDDRDIAAFAGALERAFLEQWTAAAARARAAPAGAGERSVLETFLRASVLKAAARLSGRGERRHRVDGWLALAPDARRRGRSDPAAKLGDLAATLSEGRSAGRRPGAGAGSAWTDARLGRRVVAAATMAQKGIRFDAEFLMGCLFVQFYETESLVALLEGKELDLPREIAEDCLAAVS